MYVCIYVCMYACMCVCMYVRMHVCIMYVCIFFYMNSQKPSLSAVTVASVASIVSVASALECCIVGRKKQGMIDFC